ncbi:hypothetical protein ACIBO2_57135 [Nonomuraea sp. NPDC050022]|uniref:hypothetical protein n=1 Tax=Nonomuraea sp. NPDC050022 TaxID=3364358 RepID=UPI00378FCFDB
MVINEAMPSVISFLAAGIDALLYAVIAIPAIVASILWLRNSRTQLGARTMRISLMSLGLFMILRAVYIAIKYTGIHEVLDIEVKGGMGLIIASLVCAVLERNQISSRSTQSDSDIRDK